MNPAIPGRYTRVGPLAIRLLLEALMAGPHTYAELTEACGLSRTTLCRWLTAWRRPAQGMPRRVYIAEWETDPNGRRNTPAFAWGSKPDAKPAPVNGAERQRRRRQRAARERQLRTIRALAGQPGTAPQQAAQ